jgi:hypothetical protein
MVSVHERAAREGEALRRMTLSAAPPVADPDFGDLPGVEGKYTEVMVDPQWIFPAWKLLLDDDGREYGVLVAQPGLPRGQWDQGGVNALMNRRRPDGGFCFTLIEPERKPPEPTIECIYDRCGDVHLGGRRKMLFTLTDLIEHVETFHPREAKTYRKYLDEIANNVALGNDRLQRLRVAAEQGVHGASAASQQDIPGAFYCKAEGCPRYFDTQQGRQMHKNRDHKADE